MCSIITARTKSFLLVSACARGVWQTREWSGRRHQSRRNFGQRATYSARGQEVDPQIGAGGDQDKVQFTPKSKYVNSELVSVAKKLTKGRRLQPAERHGVFST